MREGQGDETRSLGEKRKKDNLGRNDLIISGDDILDPLCSSHTPTLYRTGVAAPGPRSLYEGTAARIKHPRIYQDSTRRACKRC